MVIFKKIADIREYLNENTQHTGFIPTMGALHAGHIALIKKAKADGNLAICSIFVNPTQFNDKNDFAKYPQSVDADIEFLLEAGCDVLFLPHADEIYPQGTEVPGYDFGYLDTVLEGAMRPGHFRGVGQVVARLLRIVQPNNLYMGQKDYQQCMVVKKLLEITGMNSIELIICPTMREDDGLAMSSRNRRLNDAQRSTATTIYQCLVSIQSKQSTDSFAIVKKECEDILQEKGLVPDYVALADARNLTLLDNYSSDIPMIALIAAKTGEVRLIDNMLL